MIERYDLPDPGAGLYQREDGALVRFEDYDRLRKALESVRKEYRANIRARICDTNIAFYVSNALQEKRDA